MTRRFLGVRWWLGAAFAVVAATSTAIVVSQYSSRSESALRTNARDAAAHSAGVAASLLAGQRISQQTVASVARRTGLQLAFYNANGSLVAGKPPQREGEGVIRVQRSFRGGTLVASDIRPDVAAAINILNDQALKAGVIAGIASLLVGVVLAQLIALRLRRMSRAAEAIALGDFETPLR